MTVVAKFTKLSKIPTQKFVKNMYITEACTGPGPCLEVLYFIAKCCIVSYGLWAG